MRLNHPSNILLKEGQCFGNVRFRSEWWKEKWRRTSSKNLKHGSYGESIFSVSDPYCKIRLVEGVPSITRKKTLHPSISSDAFTRPATNFSMLKICNLFRLIPILGGPSGLWCSLDQDWFSEKIFIPIPFLLSSRKILLSLWCKAIFSTVLFISEH